MKERLDILLVNKNLAPSREKAQRLIMAGLVTVDGKLADKSGTKFDVESIVNVKDSGLKYVSRGGFKLEKAISSFNLDLNDKICIDMGASTGGFTDCMLQNNAKKIYAIDVGFGQLDYKLRINPKVINIERTNIRYLDLNLINDNIDFISIDVSFISLKHIFKIAAELISDNGLITALIKPQFEAGKEEASMGHGIIKDKKIHEDVIHKVIGYGIDNGLYLTNLTNSPIKGTKGNIEFLALFSKNKEKELLNKDLYIKNLLEQK